MKKLLLSTVSLLALANAAGAADMSVKAVRAPVAAPTWAGFYLGIQGGIAGHRGSFEDLDNYVFAGGPGAPVTYSGSTTGGVFGGNAGYNFQSGNLVYGLEGDWNALGVKVDTTTIANTCAPLCSVMSSFDTRWLATARGRVGLAVDANLFYATGGVAFGQVKDSAAVILPPFVRGTFTQDTMKVGWTVGGGIEHMFGPHWTARAEARYVDLGRSTVTCVPVNSNCVTLAGGTYRGEFRNSLLIGMAAVDYKF